MKKAIFSVITLLTFFASAQTISAEEVCVQNYGQPVVCGTHTPEYHVPVKAGFGDIDTRVLAGGFLFLSGVLYIVSVKKASINR